MLRAVVGNRSRLLLVRSSSLLSLPGLLAFAILGVAPALLLELVTQHGPIAAWAVISVISSLCALLVLVIAASLLRRMRTLARITPALDSILTLGAIAGGAALKVVIVVALARNSTVAGGVDISDRDSLLGRVVMQVIIIVVIVGITTALVSSRREHRALRDRLASERRRLDALNATMIGRLRVAEESLRREAQLAIDPALATIRIELESDSDEGSAERALAGLDEAVRTIVRPMSNRFADQGADTRASVADVPSLASAQRLLHPVDVPAAVLPWLTSIVLLAVGLVVGLAWRLPLGWYVFLVQSAIVWVIVLLAVRRCWPARFRRLPALVGFAILAVAYAALFITTQLLFEVDDLGSVRGDATWLGSGYRICAAVAISGVVMAQQQRTETDAALQRINASLLVQAGRLRRETWAIGRRMSLVMHGSVQSALISAMLLLRENSSVEARQEVLMRLMQARAALDAETWSPGMLHHGLREIVTLWGPLCAIAVHVDPGASPVIDDQPGMASCCVEVVREAVGNAVRHGGATRVAVTVVLSADGLVTVTTEDNGSGVGAEPRVGLGTRMLDEVCLSWTRVSTVTGTVLTATIA